jgi:hypothetical protein
MSREQRRQNRKQEARAAAAPGARRTQGASAPPNRRTPVRAGGGTGVPWVPFAVIGGTIALILLIAYVVWQSTQDADTTDAATRAAQNDDPSLPGVYIPDQGRGHLSGGYTPDRPQRPFCDGVRTSGDAAATPEATTAAGSPTAGATTAGSPDAGSPAAGSPAPLATSTPGPTNTPGGGATPTQAAEETASGAEPTATPPAECYLSNPPSSGQHLGVLRNVDLGGGVTLANVPPNPDVYPPDVVIPRDAIPHILEHAGIYVGYNCAEGDDACQQVVDQLADLVNQRIDNNDDRVVMARNPDLPVGEMGLSSWTRVMNFRYQDYDESEARRFIDVHACRFDPEGFC